MRIGRGIDILLGLVLLAGGLYLCWEATRIPVCLDCPAGWSAIRWPNWLLVAIGFIMCFAGLLIMAGKSAGSVLGFFSMIAFAAWALTFGEHPEAVMPAAVATAIGFLLGLRWKLRRDGKPASAG